MMPSRISSSQPSYANSQLRFGGSFTKFAKETLATTALGTAIVLPLLPLVVGEETFKKGTGIDITLPFPKQKNSGDCFSPQNSKAGEGDEKIGNEIKK